MPNGFGSVVRCVVAGLLVCVPALVRAEAAADSTAVPSPSPPAALASTDSTQADATRPAPRAPWIRHADLGPRELASTRPELVADAVDRLPNVLVRTAGAQGSPAFVGIDAGSTVAPEFVYDGIPSRSPADQDPALWDRSAVALGSLDAGRDPRTAWAGAPGLTAELDPALEGRTLMRTHFSSAARERYLRGVSVTTPQAPRVLRLDFEEWKTEQGYPLTGRLGVPVGFGRAKMRRFRAGVSFDGELGTTSFAFGRGRRFHHSNLASLAGGVERWTGEVSVGFDREEPAAYWRARAYHLDWHDDDDIQSETRDASRLGFTVSRTPQAAGWGGHVSLERWFAAFEALDRRSHPDPPYVARGAVSWTGTARPWTPFAALELVHADHAARADLGGSLVVSGPWRGDTAWSIGGRRSLRVPSLEESDGLTTVDYANGTRLRHLGGGVLPLERQDRIHARLEGPAGRANWSLGGEFVGLREGIGWSAPSGIGAETVDVVTRGGLELDVLQLTAGLQARLGSTRRGASLGLNGFRVLGEVPRVEDGQRGSGWPVHHADISVRAWHQVAGSYNRISLEARTRIAGQRHDDLLSTFAATPLVPAFSRLDLRLALQVRDAEIYLALDNVGDGLLVDVLGTVEPSRQYRWGLVWPFFN